MLLGVAKYVTLMLFSVEVGYTVMGKGIGVLCALIKTVESVLLEGMIAKPRLLKLGTPHGRNKEDLMNYADIKNVDVTNGPGVRISLFVSGCPHHCPGCFNPETWAYDYGEPFTEREVGKIIEMLDAPYIQGLSLLGGEPLAPKNQAAVLDLVKQVKEKLPGKDIWCYTGYLFEDLLDGRVGEHSQELLSYMDVLVDGCFQEELKDIRLRFRGSSNQRIIDVPKSLMEERVVVNSMYF